MNKEIKYNGFTAVPSDYESPDGDLALALNLIPEEGATLHPIMPPTSLISLDSPLLVKYIHTSASFTHYIILNPSSNLVAWVDKSDINSETLKPTLTHTLINLKNKEIYQIDSIGNTLMVLASDGIHYLLWKGATDGYKYLGIHIPELPISFGLQGEMIRGEEFQISFNNIDFWDGDIWKEFDDANKTRITEQVLAKVNKFIAENSTNEGKFMYPFFVRYAYRLYDGSLTMHSAPVLMTCSSDLAPQCVCTNLHGYKTSTQINSAKLILASMFHQLDYAVNSTALTSLKEWGDIVKSVDIFISKPIYTYDQSGECTKFMKTDYSDCYSVCKHVNQKASTTTYPLRYQKSKFMKLYAMTFDPTNLTAPTWRLMLPMREGDSIKGDITDNHLFYFLKSINLDDLKTTRTIIPVNKEYLQSLVTREVMTDDYNSHDQLLPKYAFNYNSRVNITNLRLRLFEGHNSWAMFNHTDGYVLNWSDAPATTLDRKGAVSVFYFIKQDGREIVVHESGGEFGLQTPLLWLFYPNTNCYKAVVVEWDYFSTYYEVHMEPHPTLNGAYYFGGWEGLNADGAPKASSVPSASTADGRTVDLPNKIYTSEVNNPFYFPLLGINTVGTGTILGIASAAKALSQGQFGQFPLYAFSTDGVWALQVSESGSYSARQPITRDVCVNPGSITQIDSAVLFATDRGIMLISGSTSTCLTDVLTSPDSFSLLSLPKGDIVAGLAGLSEDDLETVTFLDYLKGCGMVYDYVNQRIIVFNPNHKYAYIYSMKSKQWGMMQSSIEAAVNSYPDALAMDAQSRLVNFSHGDADASPVKGLLVSRPLKLGEGDVLKTVDTVIQRGRFRKGHVRSLLYASRNLFDWHLLRSSNSEFIRNIDGTPYKYFRVVALCELPQSESISGCSVQYRPRFTNRPR